MSGSQWLLLFHLIGAFLFVGGALVAGVLQVAATKREKPSEIALLLRTTRAGVVCVILGALMTIGLGSWLTSDLGYSFSAAWIQAAFALWLFAVVTGELGGRTARHARKLAERLAAEGDRPSEELRALVSHRPALLLSYVSSIAVVAIVVLMVWRPA